MKKLILIALAILTLASCNNEKRKYVKDAKGKPYELFVVAEKGIWEGRLGDSIKAILSQDVETLVQQEPQFDLLSITPDRFKETIATHRNLIQVNVGDKYPECKLSAEFDVYAQPQLIVSMQGPNVDTLTNYLMSQQSELLQVFQMAERNRFVNRAAKFEDKEIGQTIQQMFGFTMTIPKGYKIRTVVEPNFIWISHELPIVSQGIFIYSYPYDSKQSITGQFLIDKRNEFAKLIPGPSENSYMVTDVSVIPPQYRRLKIADRYWHEIYGQWDVQNDYMGGPFASFTTLDQANNRVITIDCYVFSPKYGKRDYMKQLESLIFSVKFPEDKTTYSTENK